MDIGLVDLDHTGFPNLALMRLSAYHKARGDQVHPLNTVNHADVLYVSAVFSWNRATAAAWQQAGAIVGGSGIDLQRQLPADVEAMRPDYDLYGIDYGVGYLMRGCIWTCSFCIVPQKEGSAHQVASIDDLVHPTSPRRRPFVVLMDNEFFWKEAWAIARLEEFTARGIDFCPSQGLDVRVVTPPLCQALAASPFWNVKRSRRQITFAFDDLQIESQYRRGVEMLLAHGMKAWQLQSFVLSGYNSTLEDDLRRVAIIRTYSIDPFIMLYRDPASGKVPESLPHRQLARWVNRRLCKTCTFAEYQAERACRV